MTELNKDGPQDLSKENQETQRLKKEDQLGDKGMLDVNDKNRKT